MIFGTIFIISYLFISMQSGKRQSYAEAQKKDHSQFNIKKPVFPKGKTGKIKVSEVRIYTGNRDRNSIPFLSGKIFPDYYH
jgi:hypothetical protein